VQAELSEERYDCILCHSLDKLREFVTVNHEKIDCLILDHDQSVQPLFNQFHEEGILLPLVLLVTAKEEHTDPRQTTPTTTLYFHAGEVHLRVEHLEQIKGSIDSAIARFLNLAPPCPPPPSSSRPEAPRSAQSLMSQQRRLAEKLRERLGYLGVYYKRDPQRFLRNLPQSEQKQLLKSLLSSYREIILDYFSKKSVNQAIDEFVNRAFFADLSVSRLLEIHMELMDEFSQQLQLEGRSDEILLDYRLALIDIIAHLGEMYRRSVPREDISLEIQFPSP
jgi:circadian clock protein KaiA